MKLLSHIALLRNSSLKTYLIDHNHNFTIRWLNFEFCSSCNLRCKWCSLDHTKKADMMNPEILEKVLDDILKNKSFNLERIDLHNAGEVLLHNNLKEMLKVIAGKKKAFKNVYITLLTNATLLTDEISNILINSSALDVIRFSVDGGTKSLYEEIRNGAKWDLVKKNILSFIELNKRNDRKIRKVEIICIIPPDKPQMTSWMEEDFKQVFSRVDDVELRYPHNWDGSTELNITYSQTMAKYFENNKDKMCMFLLKNLVVLPNGDVTVCCADLNSRGVVGNVKYSSMEELYFTKKRLNMIELYRRNKKSEINLCQKCTGYYPA
jgi:radical SAM protein with 4Fe4S-binding SPASM domain